MLTCEKNVLRKQLETDFDLAYELKLESLFMPRTHLLPLQLKHKAKRFLSEFDMSKYTKKDIYELIANAVTSAMLVDNSELRLIKAMNVCREKYYNRPIANQFFQDGLLGWVRPSIMTQKPKKLSVLARHLHLI